MAAGFFSLTRPEDLLRKLEHDLQDMKGAPSDTFKAYNFFVTAEHMLDWLFPGEAGKQERTAWRQSEPLLQVCSHLATGAKHFQAEAKHHKSVARTGVRIGNPFLSPALHSPLLNPGAFRGLIVELEGEAATQFGRTVSATRLAELLMHFWQQHLPTPSDA